jgi:hypothetical protein
MDESNSIEIVRSYAEKWRVSTPEPFRVEQVRQRFRTVAHELHFDDGHWTGFSYVERNASEPCVFDFRPKGPSLMMPPLWAAYPNYSAATIGWRMGGGEEYRYAWWDWYSKLTDLQRDLYQRTFPVPVNERAWNLWFYDVGDDDLADD